MKGETNMLLQILKADGTAEREKIRAMKERALQENTQITEDAAKILEDIRQNGMDAVERYSLQFDKNPVRRIPKEELQAAYEACDPGLRTALERAAVNIREYHEHMLAKSWEYRREDGAQLGQVVRGLERVGIYVPGGTAAYPSSVLMNAVPAKVAGVRELVMVTPPTQNLSLPVLAAANIAGVDTVFAVGGIQAIGALAYGAGEIPRVDKIVGPGNAYVAAAKKLVYGQVDIDMIAGPSEVLVIADGKVDPKYVAADLLSQAEHDRMASAVLLTDSMELARRTAQELERQAQQLPRFEIVRESMENYGCAIVCRDLKEACLLADLVAPEHLEVSTENPRELLESLHNAGAVFLGHYTPEPLGDYMAGPSHVLPTSGTARFFSPLSTDTFLKKMSVIEYPRQALMPLGEDIISLAQCEHLDAHANSVRVRLQER